MKLDWFHLKGRGGFVWRPSPLLFWLQLATYQGFNRYFKQIFENPIYFAQIGKNRQTFVGRKISMATTVYVKQRILLQFLNICFIFVKKKCTKLKNDPLGGGG